MELNTTLESEGTYRGIVQWAGIPGFHKALAEMLMRQTPDGSAILDCGSGPGAFVLRLKDLGFEVHALEVDPEIFKAVEIPCYSVDLNSDFSESVARRFDAITAIEVIEHLENTRHFLRQCNRLLQPNGILLLTTPSIESIPARLRFLITGNFRSFDDNEVVSEPTHITPIQSYLFGKAVRDCGFEILNHIVFPDNTFANSRLFTRILSRLLSIFCRGHKYGCNHVYVLRKKSELL